jgi:hypothetical protein
MPRNLIVDCYVHHIVCKPIERESKDVTFSVTAYNVAVATA